MYEKSCEQFAIEVKNAIFEYKTGATILNNLSLKIPKGKIFALLGPNGTGKTTLIRSILGQLQLKSGSVKTFGFKQKSKFSDIPGKGVGYMPQDLALFDELTIEEILKYYGTIYHLTDEEIIQRVGQLSQVLNLPEKHRIINTLSGGQKRRVSIIISMIHRPKLIILDEPTVGVDSLLRHKIWSYLDEVCQQNRQTVLITTHYIEEAKSAANIAFMNYGTVLKQSNPQKLLQQYRCQTLEAVFLNLCEHFKSKSKVTPLEIDDIFDQEQFVLKEELENFNNNNKFIDFFRIKALLKKNWIVSIRKPFFLYLYFLLPVLSLSALKLSMQHLPKNIPVVIVNDEKPANFSQLFIDSIDKKHIDLRFSDNNETAIKSIFNGNNYFSIVFDRNFTDYFDYRITDPLDLTDEELDRSKIKVYGDFSNGPFSLTLIKYLLEALDHFLQKLIGHFGFNAGQNYHWISIPKPIYGELEFSMLNVFAPGIIITMVYCLPVSLSGMLLLYDRKNSSIERMFISGVKPIEILIANFIQNIIIISIQLVFMLFVAFFFCNFTQVGSYSDVYLLLLLTSIQGTAIGFLIGLFAKDEKESFGLISFIIHPLCLMCGQYWPVESQPPILRLISDLAPLTQPLQAFRSIILRGWTLNHPVVLSGIIINIVYILILTLIDIILFQKLSK